MSHDIFDPTSPATLAERAGTEDLRRAVAVARSRLLDVLYARAQALVGTAGWVGPHRDRFDNELAGLQSAGRALDDSLASLLYALDDELDAMSHSRPSTLSEGAPTPEPDQTPTRTGRSVPRTITSAVVIPIRPDAAPA